MLRFPFGNERLLEEWINAIGFNDYLMISQNTLICCEHFTQDDYVLENGSYELSTSAVPSKFDCRYESIESSNVVEPTTDFNEINNLQNRNNNLPSVNNTNEQANIRDMQCLTSQTISSKNNHIVSGCNNKTANSSYNTSRMNGIANNKKLTCHNNSSNKFLKDIFIDQGNEINSMIYPPCVYIPRPCKTGKAVVTNEPKAKVKPIWKLNSKISIKHKIPVSFTKKCKLLSRKNKRLSAKVQKLLSRKKDFMDLQIQFIKLKFAVLETEEKLMINGINTSEYSAFRMIHEDEERSESLNAGYDFLIECQLEEQKNPKVHINNHSPIISSEYPPQGTASSQSETVIIL